MRDESHPELPNARGAVLREVAQRLCKALAPTASALLRTDFTARPVDVGPVPEDSNAPDSLCRFPLGELAADEPEVNGRVELHLSAEIAMGVVERLLGGTCKGSPSQVRPVTDVERRVLHRFVDVVRGVLRQAWNGGELPKFHPAADAPPSAKTTQGRVAIALAVGLDGRTGGAWISLPSWAAGAGDVSPAARTERAPVELAVYLPETTLPAEQADNLQPGDVIASGFPPDEEVTVSVAGIPKFVARLGRHNGKRAVTILKRLGDAPDNKQDKQVREGLSG